jgi:hypothetical protein
MYGLIYLYLVINIIHILYTYVYAYSIYLIYSTPTFLLTTNAIVRQQRMMLQESEIRVARA